MLRTRGLLKTLRIGRSRPIVSLYPSTQQFTSFQPVQHFSSSSSSPSDKPQGPGRSSYKPLVARTQARVLKKVDSAGLPAVSFKDLPDEVRSAEIKRIKDDLKRRQSELKYGDGWSAEEKKTLFAVILGILCLVSTLQLMTTERHDPGLTAELTEALLTSKSEVVGLRQSRKDVLEYLEKHPEAKVKDLFTNIKRISYGMYDYTSSLSYKNEAFLFLS